MKDGSKGHKTLLCVDREVACTQEVRTGDYPLRPCRQFADQADQQRHRGARLRANPPNDRFGLVTEAEQMTVIVTVSLH